MKRLVPLAAAVIALCVPAVANCIPPDTSFSSTVDAGADSAASTASENVVDADAPRTAGVGAEINGGAVCVAGDAGYEAASC